MENTELKLKEKKKAIKIITVKDGQVIISMVTPNNMLKFKISTLHPKIACLRHFRAWTLSWSDFHRTSSQEIIP